MSLLQLCHYRANLKPKPWRNLEYRCMVFGALFRSQTIDWVVFDDCSRENSFFIPQGNSIEQNCKNRQIRYLAQLPFFACLFSGAGLNHINIVQPSFDFWQFCCRDEIWSIFRCVIFVCITKMTTILLHVLHTKAETCVQPCCIFQGINRWIR